MNGTRIIPCPDCEAQGLQHMIQVCAECGFPPALDGRCVCETPGALERLKEGLREEKDARAEWDELRPDGARRFYEGDDPEGVRTEMIEGFGFDPAADDPEFPTGGWSAERGWAFSIPAGLVGEIYGSDRWPLGS
jgi:hypothetical protein